jgi:hypothetical protein
MIQRAGRTWLPLALLLCLAACRREAAQPPTVLAPLEGGGRIEWTGMQPCADCEGIDTRLALAQDGARRNFVLTETYMAATPVRFVTKGRWSRERDLLQLQVDDGGTLGYMVLADGRLQPRDARGRRLPGNDGDGLLTPATTSTQR